MKRILLFLLILQCKLTFAQTSYNYYNPSKFNDFGLKTIEFDSSLFILGFSSCNNQLNCSSFIKTDLKGKLIQERIFTDWPYQKNGSDVILDTDTNFVITGTRAITLTDNAVNVFKLNKDLDSTFSKIYNDPNVQFEYGQRILETKDKNYLIYSYKGLSYKWARQYLTKIDKAGNVLWEKRIEGDTAGKYTIYQQVNEIFELENGDFWMSYKIVPYVLGNDYYAGIIRTDSLGNKKVNIVLDYGTYDDEFSMCLYNKKGVLVTWNANDSSTYKMKLSYYDSLGNEVWKRKFLDDYRIGKVQTLKNGNIIIYGDRFNVNSNLSRYIMCLDSIGNIIWNKNFLYNKTLPYVDLLTSMTELFDSRLAFVGDIRLPSSNNFDILLLLLDKNGCITPGCGDSIYLTPPVANTDLLAAQEMAFRFAPNPANENIQVHFLNSLNQKSHQIRLNAMDGKTIQSYPLTPGIQDYNIDLSDQSLPKGTYILQYIREGHLVQSEKVVIIR